MNMIMKERDLLICVGEDVVVGEGVEEEVVVTMEW